MLTLNERFEYLAYILDLLQDTASTNEKREIIDVILPEVKADFDTCISILSGEIKFGYKYEFHDLYLSFNSYFDNNEHTITDVFNYLLEPITQKDLSMDNIKLHVQKTLTWCNFLEPIINRTMKIGIGKSVLPSSDISAMLAKKFELDRLPSLDTNGYYLTEKLDGNRCIARFNGTKWVFTSRNGKLMHVDFNMGGMPKHYVYDGEVLSIAQSKRSNEIYKHIVTNAYISDSTPNAFSSTSGLINRHTTNKKLVYNIFDLMLPSFKYHERRYMLNAICPESSDIRILPIIGFVDKLSNLGDACYDLLNTITNKGAEGVMINLGSAYYEHKRTNSLLKFKKVNTMDMLVYDIIEGGGKYENMVGALIAETFREDGTTVICKIGSGLSDDQRLDWMLHPEKIVNKIVEVSYFELCQSKESSDSNTYSLRFPRLKGLRKEKTETSEF